MEKRQKRMQGSFLFSPLQADSRRYDGDVRELNCKYVSTCRSLHPRISGAEGLSAGWEQTCDAIHSDTARKQFARTILLASCDACLWRDSLCLRNGNVIVSVSVNTGQCITVKRNRRMSSYVCGCTCVRVHVYTKWMQTARLVAVTVTRRETRDHYELR